MHGLYLGLGVIAAGLVNAWQYPNCVSSVLGLEARSKADILIRVRTRTTVIETSLTLALLLKRMYFAWSIFRVQPPRHLLSQPTSVIAITMLLPSALHALALPIL